MNKDKLKQIIEEYKRVFLSQQWEEEKYKWEAVKHFQDNWDINATNFSEMFMNATNKTYNLLASMSKYPRAMIKDFAEVDPEGTRAMFINLYDESKNIFKRIEKFNSDAEEMRSTYGKDKWKSHFQDLNSISTYLWLRYPDKYYIYKYSVYKDVVKELESNNAVKRGVSSESYLGSFTLDNEICKELKSDEELVELLNSVLTEDHYEDPKLKTLTIDIGYFISKIYPKLNEPDSEWFPADYSPNISKEEWVELLNDESVFTENRLKIMKRLKDHGGMATCTELANEYGKSKNFYNTGSSHLAKHVAQKTRCPIMEDDNENARWWPILYVGKEGDKKTKGSYIWKLRDELSEALDEVDLSKVLLYESSKKVKDRDEKNNVQYWWLNASPKIWSFSDIRVGEIQSYTLFNENGNKRRIYQNFLDAKAGDLVIGYETTPMKRIVALGRIVEENDGERIYFEKTEGLIEPIDFEKLKEYLELESMEFFINPQGSFFKVTKSEYDFIMDIIREENPPSKNKPIESYSKEEFLKEVYMVEEEFDTLTSLLKNKKNIILQGAPGVGKTFASKRVAYAIMEEKNEDRIKFIQFHQNYSYEDFIMGYKPAGEGFELKYGVFYNFCKKAENRPKEPFFFIIDEINRGNMSKIFGELLMLIENDYRNKKATLAYNGMSFSVPDNLYIIGMMNTADRSLAMIDYALRRRFSFYEMEPGFNSAGFKGYQRGLNDERFDALIEKVRELNKDISSDSSLGKGFNIGHSYFCGAEECSDEWLMQVVEYDILPMLSEYWFDEPAKLQCWENILRGVFDD